MNSVLIWSFLPQSRGEPQVLAQPLFNLLRPHHPNHSTNHECSAASCLSGQCSSRSVATIGLCRPLLIRLQRAVAPVAASLLAGGLSFYPKRTVFAEEPRDLVCIGT